MEKQKIYVNYSNSGVKTLDGFGKFFYVIAVIATLIMVIGGIMFLANIGSYSGRDEAAAGGAMFISSLPIVLGSFMAGAICRALANMAKTALFKRLLLEEKYDFIEGEIPAPVASSDKEAATIQSESGEPMNIIK